MDSNKIERYDAPHHFEPLMPEAYKLEPLLELASDLTRSAMTLGSSAASTAQVELRALLRNMNSYYTNRIEGEHTRPSDIDSALQKNFSTNADLARKQRLAVAHIRTEEFCEDQLDARIAAGEDVKQWLFSAEALGWLHKQLFEGLDGKDLALADGTSMEPGQMRGRQVAVGRHEAPAFEALPLFIQRWSAVYSGVRRGEASIVAIAASHHRLAWMHPFLDGNGRLARLHSHLLLHAAGLTHGLWSPLRGFARTEQQYRDFLQAADEHRRGDLDGRGNLTQAGLIGWIEYTVKTCIDQVHFMGNQLNVAGMQDRISAALTFEETTLKSGVRQAALRPLHYLFATQPELGRADFKSMTGLGDRVATDALSALLKHGYLVSDSPYGKVRFGIPRHALRFYFPSLWPEAEQDAAMVMSQRRPTTQVTPAARRPKS